MPREYAHKLSKLIQERVQNDFQRSFAKNFLIQIRMPGPTNTLLIEGSFRELVEELADFVDGLRKAQNPESAKSLKEEIAPLLDKVTQTEEKESENKEEEVEESKDAVLEVVSKASSVLSTAAEKDVIPSYNLLIHLLAQSSDIDPYLPPLCKSLSNPDSLSSVASPGTRASLSLTLLTTIFNILDTDDGIRYPVFSAILDCVSRSGLYENLRPYLPNLDKWLEFWETKPEQQRRLFLKLSQIASQAAGSGQQDTISKAAQESYGFLLKAIRTIPASEASNEEARKLALEALRTALISPTHFDFEDLTALDAVQALRTSEAVWFQLLELFVSDSYDDFMSFCDEHPDFLQQQNLDKNVLSRKIRLLTVASLAASSNNSTRALPYIQIAEALQINLQEVEMWVIDVIRAGLVEGKLSQQRKEFLVHRATYRVFTEGQWRDVALRLDVWTDSLRNVLEVIRVQKEEMVKQKEEELKSVESKLEGAGGGGGGGGRRARREVLDTQDGIGA